MKDMSTQPIKIYVGNVPVVARNSELKELFEKFGKVVECDILKDFAFVHMDDTNDAKAAIAGLHDTLWKGARLRVELSTTRTNKGEPGERYSSRDRDRDTDTYSSSSKHHQNGRSERDRDHRDHRDRTRRDGPPPPPLPPSSYDSNRLPYDRKAGASAPYPSRFSDARRDSYHPYAPESRYYQDDGPLSAHPYSRGGGVRDSRYPMDANRYPYPVNDLAYSGGLPSRSRNSRDEMRLSSNDLGLELIRAANNSGAYSSREREPPYFDRRGGGGGGPPPPLSSTNGMRNASAYDSFYRGPPLPPPPAYHQSYNGYPASSRYEYDGYGHPAGAPMSAIPGRGPTRNGRYSPPPSPHHLQPHYQRHDNGPDSIGHRRNHSPLSSSYHRSEKIQSPKGNNDSLKRTNGSRRRHHHQSPPPSNDKTRSRSPRRVASRHREQNSADSSPPSSSSSPPPPTSSSSLALDKEKRKSSKSVNSKRINSEIVVNSNNNNKSTNEGVSLKEETKRVRSTTRSHSPPPPQAPSANARRRNRRTSRSRSSSASSRSSAHSLPSSSSNTSLVDSPYKSFKKMRTKVY